MDNVVPLGAPIRGAFRIATREMSDEDLAAGKPWVCWIEFYYPHATDGPRWERNTPEYSTELVGIAMAEAHAAQLFAITGLPRMPTHVYLSTILGDCGQDDGGRAA